MTMRKCKLVILAIAVLLQVHAGAGYLFCPKPSNCSRPTRREDGTCQPAGNAARVDHAGTRMVGRTALPPSSRVLTGNEKVEGRGWKAEHKSPGVT
jgi:hypothetical protein